MAIGLIQWVSFAAILGPYLKSLRVVTTATNHSDLPLQGWNVVEVSSSLLLVPWGSKNSLHTALYN